MTQLVSIHFAVDLEARGSLFSFCLVWVFVLFFFSQEKAEVVKLCSLLKEMGLSAQERFSFSPVSAVCPWFLNPSVFQLGFGKLQLKVGNFPPVQCKSAELHSASSQ